MKSAYRVITLEFFTQCLVLDSSGGGTVDFQEFVGGLSAFSSRGGREEKLRCPSRPLHLCPGSYPTT